MLSRSAIMCFLKNNENTFEGFHFITKRSLSCHLKWQTKNASLHNRASIALINSVVPSCFRL